jgi:hypothetical protein
MWTAAMAETTSTKKLVPVQPAALRLPGRDSASRGHQFLIPGHAGIDEGALR